MSEMPNRGAEDFRRHVPGPPCMPWPESAPPPGTPLSQLAPGDDPWPVLAAVAASLDRLHGHRVAHGALTDERVRFDGAAAWFQDVPRRAANDERGTPRQRDRAYFAELCGRWLNQPTPAGADTAAGMLARLRPPPPAPLVSASEGHESAEDDPLPAAASTVVPEPAAVAVEPPAPRAGKIRQWAFAVVALALLATAASVFWWRRERQEASEEPLLPPGLLETVGDAVPVAVRLLAAPEPGARASGAEIAHELAARLNGIDGRLHIPIGEKSAAWIAAINSRPSSRRMANQSQPAWFAASAPLENS